MATTVNKRTISSMAAAKAIKAAEAKAKEIGVPMCIAVCDEGGNLKAFSRMDGAALFSVQIAQDKAYTAVGFNMPSDQWYPFIKDDGPLALGAPKVDRLIIFGGGYPISANGQMVGGIGVSGGHYTQDMEVAKAGLAAIS